MKRTIMILVVLALLVLAGVGAYMGGLLDPLLGGDGGAAVSSQDPSATPPSPAAKQAASAAADNAIIVDARVSPQQSAELSLPAGGVVADILIQEGDAVEADALLLKLDDASQRTAVARAQADLQRVQARLDLLRAGPRSEEVATAQASIAAAEARLMRLGEDAMTADLAAAQGGLAAAQAGLAKVLEGASAQTLIAARADLANAEAELQRAQRAYNEVKWRNDVGATPQSAQLQVASNNYEAAKARLSDLENGTSVADINAARAQVAQAQAQLDKLEATYPADVALAKADLAQAQAQLDLTLAGSRPEEIESAEADVAAATAGLQQALVNLGNTELHAPFAGVVAELDIEKGEQVSAGAPIARLADLSRWQVRTEDLTEFDVTAIQPGQPVTLSFDAIPDLILPGEVTRIRPIGGDLRGDIVYTAVIEPLQNDDRLRWNMTAVATFAGE